jgi:hypothetical protein
MPTLPKLSPSVSAKYPTGFRESWLPFLSFIILSFILYYPTINRSFASDDFLVLRRVGLDKTIFIKGFFRPLSDLTLYLNYKIGRFDPTGYYLFGILLHSINGYFLYIFCKRWKWTTDTSLQRRYAFLAAILFLCYPFHNECIVWVLGRAASIANAFGILALLILVGDSSEKTKIFLVCLCYFIGMTSYESIMLLPLMVMVILYQRDTKRSRYAFWGIAMAATLILHFIVRIEISGVIVGSYGEGFFEQRLLHYGANLFKVTGRLFLPPIEHSIIFATLTALLIISLAVILTITYRRILNKKYLLKSITLLGIACVMPVLFSVSTKTSESDRFLHFPSFFLCSTISLVMVNLIDRFRRLILFAVTICTYYIFFLQKNNSNWIKASEITKNILKTIGLQETSGKIFIINLPDEFKGAYIFRLGLKDALVINKIDSSRIVIVNHLRREAMLKLPAVLHIAKRAEETDIPPFVVIKNTRSGKDELRTVENHIYLIPGTGNTILYWNNQELVKLPQSPAE